MFLAANLTKLVHGAWLPLLIAVIAFTVMTTWQRGQEIVTHARAAGRGTAARVRRSARRLSAAITSRTPGTAVFLNRGKETTAPGDAGQLSSTTACCIEHVVIMAIDTLPVPRVPDSERTEIDDLGYGEDGIFHLTAHFGYMDKPDVLGVLRLLSPAQTEGAIAIDDASYFLSKLELTKGTAPNMARWRKQLFIATSYITADAADYFGLPPDRTVVMGSRIQI